MLKDSSGAATLVLRIEKVMGVASKSWQFKIAEWNFGSQNFLALVSREWRMEMVNYFADIRPKFTEQIFDTYTVYWLNGYKKEFTSFNK